MTLVEFLTARIDEDEAAAFGTSRDGYRLQAVNGNTGTTVGGARLRAECDAKRRIIELHRPIDGMDVCRTCSWDGDEESNWVDVPCPTVQTLAAPYADHPDFDPAWRIDGSNQ